MRAFQIQDVKSFMSHLLLSNYLRPLSSDGGFYHDL